MPFGVGYGRAATQGFDAQDDELAQYLEEQERRSGTAPLNAMGGMAGAGAVAARPGYNPQLDPTSGAFVNHERRPGDGKDPTPYAGMQPGQGMRQFGQAQQVAASPVAAVAPQHGAMTSRAARAQTGGAGGVSDVARKAAPAAAAAATGGFGAALAPAMGVLAEHITGVENRNDMRQDMRSKMAASRAQELGYPGYGIAAARTNKAADELEGVGYLKSILGLANRKR